MDLERAALDQHPQLGPTNLEVNVVLLSVLRIGRCRQNLLGLSEGVEPPPACLLPPVPVFHYSQDSLRQVPVSPPGADGPNQAQRVQPAAGHRSPAEITGLHDLRG